MNHSFGGFWRIGTLRKTDIMLPIHFSVPRKMREQIEASARRENTSIGAVARAFLAAGMNVLETR